ncbi:MAG: hypothetical protein HC782_05810 [Gammaproteobacteria bacterium]|nr:hypothetical protein [Gammaproteobacteria bacterium]
MAIVLLIITILVTAIGLPIATQVDQQRTIETQKQLENIKETIYGFAMTNGRLPCPATATSAGRESFCTTAGPGACTETLVLQSHGRCAAIVGFVPSSSLGLSSVDAGGFSVDAWQDGTNLRRITYGVSQYQNPASTFVMTRADGIKTDTMSTTTSSNHLFVCSTGLTTSPPTSNCGTMTVLADKAPFVLLSFGKDATATAFDSINNQNGDVVFTSGAQNATFDDIVTWGNLNTLFARMVQAGKITVTLWRYGLIYTLNYALNFAFKLLTPHL